MVDMKTLESLSAFSPSNLKCSMWERQGIWPIYNTVYSIAGGRHGIKTCICRIDKMICIDSRIHDLTTRKNPRQNSLAPNKRDSSTIYFYDVQIHPSNKRKHAEKTKCAYWLINSTSTVLRSKSS